MFTTQTYIGIYTLYYTLYTTHTNLLSAEVINALKKLTHSGDKVDSATGGT